MKAIEINEKQKEMLLEMCRALFPEYENPQFSVRNYSICCGWSNNYLIFDIFDEGTPIIHWFEFCMTSLTNKLAISDLENYNLPLETYMDCIVNKWHHPVDYLYKQFKELKL
jgi:hypothetical protein